jgi:hypothetical protein
MSPFAVLHLVSVVIDEPPKTDSNRARSGRIGLAAFLAFVASLGGLSRFSGQTNRGPDRLAAAIRADKARKETRRASLTLQTPLFRGQ